MQSFFTIYYSVLLKYFGSDKLSIGLTNVVFALAITVIIILFSSAAYEKFRPIKFKIKHDLIFGVSLFLISCIFHYYMVRKMYYMLPQQVFVKGVWFPSVWLLIFVVVAIVVFSIHRRYKKMAQLKPQKSRQRIAGLSANGYGTLLNELRRSFKNQTPFVTFTHGELSKKDLAKFNEKQKQWSFHRQGLWVTNEDRGIVLGSPGSGKTTYLITQLVEWMKSGRSFVATDVKPEIWAILKANKVFELFGYQDWVFNPTDVKSHHYNIFSEVKDSSELNEILNIIIKDESAEAVIFNENARRILKAVLLELGENASLVNAQKFINSMDSNSELLKTLKQSENTAVSNIAVEVSRTAQNDRLFASIMTALAKAFEFLDDQRIREVTSGNAEGFYLKEVLMKPKQAVFLQFDQKYKSSTASLFGAMVAHTMRILQANQNRGAVFIALDEIINCAPIPKFTDLLNTIRSANMPTFLYLQSLEGLNRLYGLNADKLFLGSSNYKVVFKIGDISTAEEFSKLIGKTETTYFSYSESSSDGVSNSDQGGSRVQSNSSGYSESTKLEYIIEPDELTKLQPHTAVVTYNGTFGTLNMPVYWDYFDTPVRIAKASPSDWLEHQKKNEVA